MCWKLHHQNSKFIIAALFKDAILRYKQKRNDFGSY